MKFLNSLIIVSIGLLSVEAAILKRSKNKGDKDEICIESIVPCPDKCPDTCIYPNLPCPKQYTPHCPGDKHHHHNKKRADIESCTERPCPRVRLQPCPKECAQNCHFVNPADPCCPYSGKPVCKLE